MDEATRQSNGDALALAGRVVLVTGAGRGLGREHARLLARCGARVVANDVDESADELVAELAAEGADAVAVRGDVGEWRDAERMVTTAVEHFDDLHAVVNNAGIIRDNLLVNLTEEDWDDVIRVHLKGHFAISHFAADFWRARYNDGRADDRRIVNTSSTSGIMANPGQTNYGAAKSGIIALTRIAAKELGPFRVQVNAVIPAARTRLTMSQPGLDEIMEPRDGQFDEWDPANVSPLIAYLASAACCFNGEVFLAHGGVVRRMRPWTLGDEIRDDRGWDVDRLARAFDDVETG